MAFVLEVAVWLAPPACIAFILFHRYIPRRWLIIAAAGSLALMALCGWALGSPWWEPALLLAGAGLLAVECLIPGFGPAGVLGIAVSLAGFYLTAGGRYFSLRLLAALLPLALCPLLHRRYGRPEAFPKRFVQQTVNDAAAGYVAHAARPELEGQTGVALTALRPTGRAMIAGQRVDVICTGSYLEAGSTLRVCSVAPGRVEVERLSESSSGFSIT